MSNAVEFTRKPEAEEMYLLAGWRQWADAGSVSSGLPEYLIDLLGARSIGSLRPDGFYIYQVPGTHDLMRPVIRFNQGYPEFFQSHQNEFFYAEYNGKGLVIFLGDEPQLDGERYVSTLLDAAQTLKVRRIIGFGGVYGELPYKKERMVSAIYSKPEIKRELERLSVNFSDYQGGASIGSFVCRRAAERDAEYIGFYAFVPAYDFSDEGQLGNSIRLENDYSAWLGVMRRVNYMLKLGVDLSDLEEKNRLLIETVDEKIAEIDRAAPHMGLREYLDQITERFEEVPFNPLDDVWEDELRRLFNKFDEDEAS